MSVLITQLLQLSPDVAAEQLRQEANRDWFSRFVDSLEPDTPSSELRRFMRAWGLNQSKTADLFGVSRQALGKWLTTGVPHDRRVAVADLVAATDLLEHYVKPERIPAVVRRSSARLGDRSLLDFATAGPTRELLRACRDMFDFNNAHA